MLEGCARYIMTPLLYIGGMILAYNLMDGSRLPNNVQVIFVVGAIAIPTLILAIVAIGRLSTPDQPH